MILRLFFIAFLTVGCAKTDENTKFVAKYKNEDFTKFKGYSFFVRGFDQSNPIVFVYTKNCKQPLVLTTNAVLNKILKTSRHLQIDSCTIDTKIIEVLVIDFLKYNINDLEVDEQLNVFVKPTFFEGKSKLIRFSKPETRKGTWKKIDDNWYLFQD